MAHIPYNRWLSLTIQIASTPFPFPSGKQMVDTINSVLSYFQQVYKPGKALQMGSITEWTVENLKEEASLKLRDCYKCSPYWVKQIGDLSQNDQKADDTINEFKWSCPKNAKPEFVDR